MDKGREAIPDSWRRYTTWSVRGARLAFICSLLALPLCVLALVATVAEESPGRLFDGAMAAGLGLALLAVLLSGAVLWLRSGIEAAPRLAWWALVVGSVGLALHLVSLLVALTAIARWEGPA